MELFSLWEAQFKRSTPPVEKDFIHQSGAKVGASYLQFNCPVNVIFRLTWSTDGPVFLNGNRLTMESALTTAFSGYNALRYIISGNG
ncbi:MAG: hypothetical protein U0X76_00100 [Bacteroidia bacterium]